MPDSSTTPGIEINITGNIDGLRDAMNQATREARTFANSGVTPLVSSLQNAYNAQRNFQRSLSAGNLTIRDSRGVFVNARTAINSTTDATARLASSTNRTGQIVTNFGRILSDLPFGFIAIQNNIDPLVQSLGLASGIGLAFTIAGAAATTLVQKYGSLSNAFRELTGIATDATRAQDRYNQVAEAAGKSAGSQLAKLEILKSALSDVNLSQKDRIDLVNEYNKVADKSNQISTKQISDLGAINSLISQQIQLIGQRALAQAAENKLGEAAAKLLEVQIKTNPILNKTSKILIDQASAAAEATKGIKGLRLATEEEALADTSLAGNIKGQFAQISKIQNSREYKEAEKALAEAQKEFNKQLGEVSPFLSIDGLTTKDTTKTTKNLKTLASILSLMEAKLKDVDTQAKLTNASFDSISADKIGIIQTALTDLAKIGVSPTSETVKDLTDRINFFGAASLGTIPIVTKDIQALGKAFKTIKVEPASIDALREILNVQDKTSQLFTTNKPTIKPVLQTAPALESLDKNRKKFESKVLETQQSIQYKIDKTQIRWGNISSGLGPAIVDVGSQLRGLASNFAAGLGEVVAGVITGGDSLGKSLYKLVGVMGSFLKDFGKSLIEAATLRIIAEKTLLSNPYVALAAGVAAIAVGSLLQNKMPSFATGGAAYEPMTARIGDNPGREEYVIPSEVLDKLGNRRATTNITGIIRGNDILLVTNRSARSNVRINGV